MAENVAAKRSSDLIRKLIPKRFRGDIPLVPVVRLSGTIGFSTPLRPGLTLASVARTLERAFAMRRAKAIALAINSPGGSPVQSHLIYQRIRQLSAEKKIPVIAFVEDVGASGGYMIACAADEIVADQNSIVGSIGVIGGSFGFDRLIEKIGVERRLYTAGTNKAMLDPFLPEKQEDVARLKEIQQKIHQSFIALVKTSRGGKLTGPESALFSGEYWIGSTALGLGIVDSLGDLRGVLRARYGDEVRMPVVAERRGLLSRVGIGRTGLDLWSTPGFADELVSALEARALWSRYGL